MTTIANYDDKCAYLMHEWKREARVNENQID